MQIKRGPFTERARKLVHRLDEWLIVTHIICSICCVLYCIVIELGL